MGADGTATAVLCPGHGGEHGAMRARVAEWRPDLLELAERLVGADPFRRLEAGTAFVQPAIYCASLAAWEAVKHEIDPIALAGHSLGEFSALAIAGSISAEDGLRLVVVRGEACQRVGGSGSGGMTILRAGFEEASELAAEYALAVVNDNAPRQVAVAGRVDQLTALERSARERGIAAKRLPTAVPFHTEAMRGAAEEMAEELAKTVISPPRVPVVSAASAESFVDVRAELAGALVRPVRWRSVALALQNRGVVRFVDAGPGRILARLVSQTLDGAISSSLEDRFA